MSDTHLADFWLAMVGARHSLELDFGVRAIRLIENEGFSAEEG